MADNLINRFFLALLDLFMGFWGVESKLSPAEIPEKVDLIVPLSYAITTNKGGRTPRLATGTVSALDLALRLKKRFPEARLAFCNSAHEGVDGRGATESRLKREMLERRGYQEDFLEVYGENSIEEAEKIRGAFGSPIGCIMVVSGRGHSPRAEFVWEQVFPELPKNSILFACFRFEDEVDTDHASPKQRNIWKWLIYTVGGYYWFRIRGIENCRHLKHAMD